MNFPGKGGVRALTQGLVTHRHEIFYNFPSLPTLLCALSDHLRGPLQSTYPSYIVLIFIPHLSCTRCCLRHQQEDSCSQGASGLIGSFDWVSREGLSEQLVISTEIYITGRSQPWDNYVDKHFRPREHLVARQGLSRNLWHCEFGWATRVWDSEKVREGPDPGRRALWNWWGFFFSFPYCST